MDQGIFTIPASKNTRALLFFVLPQRIAAGIETEAGTFFERDPAIFWRRRIFVDRLSRLPHLQVEFDAPAIRHAGMEMHIVMRPTAAVCDG